MKNSADSNMAQCQKCGKTHPHRGAMKTHIRWCQVDWKPQFWAKVEKTDSCWLWRGAIEGAGYGHFTIRRVHLRAHHVSWCIANGREPQGGLYIRHTCDVPNCVNPDHLRLGTHQENMQDKIKRDRTGHKLKADDVRRIKVLLREKKLTKTAIGAMFGISDSFVGDISRGRKWAHVQ